MKSVPPFTGFALLRNKSIITKKKPSFSITFSQKCHWDPEGSKHLLSRMWNQTSSKTHSTLKVYDENGCGYIAMLAFRNPKWFLHKLLEHLFHQMRKITLTLLTTSLLKKKMKTFYAGLKNLLDFLKKCIADLLAAADITSKNAPSM